MSDSQSTICPICERQPSTTIPEDIWQLAVVAGLSRVLLQFHDAGDPYEPIWEHLRGHLDRLLPKLTRQTSEFATTPAPNGTPDPSPSPS